MVQEDNLCHNVFVPCYYRLKNKNGYKKIKTTEALWMMANYRKLSSVEAQYPSETRKSLGCQYDMWIVVYPSILATLYIPSFMQRAHEVVHPEHPEQGLAFKCVSVSTHKLLSSRVESHQGPALKATNSFIFSPAHKRRVFCKLPARSDQQKVLS